ncbi:MAG: hypothetical protein GY940_03995 [bacterium]|nr:hypothetical protein [bacterium]
MKNPLPIFLISFLLLGLYQPNYNFSQEKSATDLNTIYKTAMDAYQSKDFSIYLESFKTLDRLRPNHPVIMYNLAAGYSLNKQAPEAILYLKKLILIDANPKIADDKDFEPLRQTPAFKALLQEIKRIRTPISNSRPAFTVKDRGLHPESVAYDPVKKIFYLGSVHKRKIVYLDSTGKVVDFTRQGQDGLDAVMGIRIDSKNRHLWAASNALPNMTGFEKKDEGRTGVFKYHLDSRKLVKKYILDEGPGHGFDDVALHPRGDVYISGTRRIYRINAHRDQLELFLTDSPFRSLQGIDFCGQGEKIIAADWTSGLYLIDIASKKVAHKILPPPDISLKGIDGLYYLKKSNSFIAIQNGIKPMRVMRFYLDSQFKKVTRYTVIERANPLLNEPTLGVFVGKTFYYIANSPWQGYTKNFTLLPPEKLQDIVVLKAFIK